MTKVAIMITSCDSYKECWKPMIYSLDKYWPDCEWPRYLVTNFEDEDLNNTTIIKVGDDNRSWCNLAKKGLEKIDADFIIFFQEDYWLDRKVCNDAIKQHILYMTNNRVDYLKIQDDIRRDNHRIGKSDYCFNPIDRRYAFNTAIAIWRKSVMPQMLPDDWSGWTFERQIMPYVKKNGININSQVLFSHIISEKGISYIKGGAIERGVWTKAGVEFLRENHMDEIISKRGIMGPLSSWIFEHKPHPQSIWRYPFWGATKILRLLKVNW